MPSTISPDSLASSMARIVKSYAAEERKDAGEAVKKTARKTVQRLKKTSPKKKGGYSKGWRSKVEEGIGAGSTAVIYNTKKPGLTHLLEKGHEKRDGGFVRGIPHIEPAFRQAAEELERDMGI